MARKKSTKVEDVIEINDTDENDEVELHRNEAVSELDQLIDKTKEYINASYNKPSYQECVDMFNDIVDEEYKDDILRICSLANDFILRQFNISLAIPQISALIFLSTYDSMLAYLKNKSKTMKSYEIKIASRFIIGFDDKVNDNDEKQGNLMIYLKHLKTDLKNIGIADKYDDAIQLTREWNSANIDKDTTAISDIAVAATKRLHNAYKIRLSSDELIIPIFTAVYESLVGYLKLKRHTLPIGDNFMYEIPFLGCFTVKAQEGEDGNDIIAFTPSPLSKAELKDDSVATTRHE